MTTQTEILNDLAALRDKLSAFINGPAGSTIATDSGALKTLNGIAEEIKGLRYVQRIVDYTTFGSLEDNATEVSEGELARVVADPDLTLRGIYQKDGMGGFEKVSYADIYDLHDALPNPWNYEVKEYGASETVANIKVATLKIPTSSSVMTVEQLQGSIKYIIDGSRVVYTGNFRLDVYSKDSGTFGYRNTRAHETVIDPDIVYSSYAQPAFLATHTLDGSMHVFDIFFVPFKNGSNVIVPGRVSIKYNGIDSDKFVLT